jgi:transcriptional regulator with XRE-family HTH domain
VTLVQGMPPAVARHRVRLALRRAREARGLTQQYVAATLEWSLSKVNRIESGDVNVSSTDLQAMLRLFEVTDPDRVQQLLAEARQARSRGWWWEKPHYRENLTPGILALMQYEMGASEIRVFHPTLVPGLLQTHDYAEYVLNFWANELTEAERDTRLEIRMWRREQALMRPDPPNYLVILDESVMSRHVGGPQIMSEQLNELAALAGKPHITVRIMPFADAAVLTMLGPFIIFDLGDDDSEVLYREGHLLDELNEEPTTVRRYRKYFDQMWGRCMTRNESLRQIECSAAGMSSSIDRSRPLA